MLERLLRDHRNIRDMATALLTMVEGITPPPMEPLSTLRWDIARTIMAHLAFEDRSLYSRIEQDERPAVRALAESFRRELADEFDSYAEFGKMWTPDRIVADWDGYRHISIRHLHWLMARMDREVAELFPFLSAGLPETHVRSGAVISWARDAFDIKDGIIGYHKA